MIKVALLLPVMLALEVWAFTIYREHPLGGKPAYFHVVTLIVQFLMVWAGIESARWLLRRSVVSKSRGPFEDHFRLWVWIGPFGGVWLSLACLLAGWVAQTSAGPLAGFLIVAHLSGGALLWCLSSAWVLPALMADQDTTVRDWFLTVMGFLSHVLGFAAYALVFPGDRTPLRFAIHPLLYLVGTGLIFCYLTFYVYAAVLTWAPFLSMLKPPPPEK